MFGLLFCDECMLFLWIVGRLFEKFCVVLFFLEVEVVIIDVVLVDLVFFVVFSLFCWCEIDGYLDGFVFIEEIFGEGVDIFFVDNWFYMVFE